MSLLLVPKSLTLNDPERPAMTLNGVMARYDRSEA